MLLKNLDIRVHPKCKPNTIVWPAIEGPHRKEIDIDSFLSYLLGAAIVAAVVVTCLDITIWRP